MAATLFQMATPWSLEHVGVLVRQRRDHLMALVLVFAAAGGGFAGTLLFHVSLRAQRGPERQKPSE